MTLSKRLQNLNEMVQPGYAAIWDCCCDHGYLGTSLLARQAAPVVHLLDIVPHLMERLEDTLKADYPAGGWQVHCMNVADLPLQAHSGKQLIIMAGIGGDLMTELISALAEANPKAEYDLLLCPIRQQFNLRTLLRQRGFGFKAERLIAEKNRFYEMLLVSSPAATHSQQEDVSPAGGRLWQQSPVADDYLSATLAHYRQCAKGQRPADMAALAAYQSIAARLA